MSAFRRIAPAACALGLLAIVATGCAVPPPGPVGYGVSAPGAFDFGADYYQPFGGFYGGWGRNYYVGPFRHADHRAFFRHGGFGHPGFGHGGFGHGGFGHGGGHVFVPSIPGGGGHGGGGHGVGGHGR